MTPRLTRIAIILILMLQIFEAWTQQLFPVQVRPSVRSASVLLSDYEDPANFSVQVRFNDLTVPNYKMRMKVRFSKDNKVFESREGIVLEMSGGQTYLLNRNDLRTLLAPGNLEGNAMGTDENNVRVLSEGMWRISFSVYDYNTNVPVSNSAADFVQVAVNLFDPPFLNTPHNVSMLDLQTNGRNIMFSWTPRSIISSPSNRIKYSMRLIRVEPIDRNPYDAMMANAFEVENEPFKDLSSPVFIYDQNMFPLEEGAVYAWQIKAYEEIMIGGERRISSARFRNRGESEVFTFSIKESCNQIVPYQPQITDIGSGQNQVVLGWSEDENHTQYEVKYRPMGTVQPWSLDYSDINELTLTKSQLQPGIKYEYVMRAKCNNWLDQVYGGTFKLPVSDCPPPAPLYITANNDEGIHLKWDEVASATAYNIRYQHNSGGPEESAESNGTEFTLPKIEEGYYTIRVDALCGTETGIGEEQTIEHEDTDYVGDCPVPEPVLLTVSSLGSHGDTLAQAFWPELPVHESFEFSYRHRDSTTFISNTFLTPHTSEVVAHPGQLYAYTIKYNCANGKSSTSPPGWFKIDDNGDEDVITEPATANCFPPASTAAEPRSETKAKFEWLGVGGANEYQLFYAPHGTDEWEVFSTTQKFAKITDLLPGGKYDYKVRCRCGSDFSIFTDIGFLDMDLEDGRRCDTIPFFVVRNVSETEVQLAWAYGEEKNGFLLAYVEESQSWDDPYTENLNNIDDLLTSNFSNDTLRYTVGNLEPGATYEFKLQGNCGTDRARFNGPISATTKEVIDDSDCGLGGVCDRSLTDHIENVSPEDTIYIADSYMIIQTVEAAGNDRWSGTAITAAPFIGLSEHIQMASSFEELHINTKACVVEGSVNIDSVNMYLLDEETRQFVQDQISNVTNALDSISNLLTMADDALETGAGHAQTAQDYFQGGSNTGRVKTGALGPQVIVNSNISADDISVEGGALKVDGQIQQATLPALIKDSEGEVFSVNADGQIIRAGAYEEDFELPSDTLADVDFYVNFKNNTNSRFGFDAFQPRYGERVAMQGHYLKIEDKYFSAKAIVPAEIDYVDFEIEGDIDASKMRFVNREGFVFSHSGNTITLAGGPENDAQEVFAMYNDGGEEKLIGALLLASYPVVTKKVVLVPVKSEHAFDKDLSAIEQKLNEVYNKVGIRYEIELDDSFFTNVDWCENGDCSFSTSGSQLLGNDYTGKEKAIRDAYLNFKDPEDLDPDAAYLFTISSPVAPSDDEELQGKMAFGKQFGFLYNVRRESEAMLGRTLAHELAHGNFQLHHIHANRYLGDDAKYTSDNLMSYKANPSSIELNKVQWDIIHDPGVTWGVFSRDGDQEAQFSHIWFQDPSGILFMINARDYELVSVVREGPVISFKYKSELYSAAIEGGKFYGYYKEGDNNPFLQEIIGEPNKIGYVKSNLGDVAELCFVDIYLSDEQAPSEVHFAKIPGGLDNKGIFISNTSLFATSSEPQDLRFFDETLFECKESTVHNSSDSKFKFSNNPSIQEISIHGKQYVLINAGPDYENQDFFQNEEGESSEEQESQRSQSDYEAIFSDESIDITETWVYDNGKLYKRKADGSFVVESIERSEIEQLKENVLEGNFSEKSKVFVDVTFERGERKEEVVVGFSNSIIDQSYFANSSISSIPELNKVLTDKFNNYSRLHSDNDLLRSTGGSESQEFLTDGSQTVIKNASYLQTISGVIKQGQKLLENLAIPKSVYIQDEPDIRPAYDKSIINTSPTACGIADGLIEEIKSIPEIVVLIADLAIDTEARDALWDAFNNLSFDDLKQMGSKVYANIKETLLGTEDKHWHGKGKFTFEGMSMLFGGSMSRKGKEALENISNSVSDIKRVTQSSFDSFLSARKDLANKFKVLDDDMIDKSSLDGFINKIDNLGDAKNDFIKALDAPDLKAEELAKFGKFANENPSLLTKETLEEFREIFKLRNGELVDSWNSFKKAGLDDLARKTDNLEALNKAMKQEGYGSEYFERLLKSKENPQKFIDDYVSKVGANGKFVDNALETEYSNYLVRKQRQGKSPRDRSDWKEASDYMKNNSPTARGNAFNDLGKLKYDINELNLKLPDGNNVRVDSYVPASQSPTGKGMIISRKATDLIDIEESTFRKHLQELKSKYAPGTLIRSDKFPRLDGQTIQGKQYLEIPESNKSFYDIERYKNIAEKEYGIELIFLAE